MYCQHQEFWSKNTIHYKILTSEFLSNHHLLPLTSAIASNVYNEYLTTRGGLLTSEFDVIKTEWNALELSLWTRLYWCRGLGPNRASVARGWWEPEAADANIDQELRLINKSAANGELRCEAGSVGTGLTERQWTANEAAGLLQPCSSLILIWATKWPNMDILSLAQSWKMLTNIVFLGRQMTEFPRAPCVIQAHSHIHTQTPRQAKLGKHWAWSSAWDRCVPLGPISWGQSSTCWLDQTWLFTFRWFYICCSALWFTPCCPL